MFCLIKGNDKFSVNINHNFFQVKNPKKADLTFAVNNKSKDNAVIISKPKDINDSYPFNQKRALENINKRLKKLDIDLEKLGVVKNKEGNLKFNSYHFQLFVKAYDMKNDETFCYIYKPGHTLMFSYSIQAIDFIIETIKKSPIDLIEDLKKMVKK